MNGQMLPVVRAANLASTTEQIQWLIHELWAESAVGVLGGPAKSYKTWLALDMAVSLASHTPCIGTFPPGRQGRVLLYAAEDSQDILKQRLDAICGHRGLDLVDLDIFAITAGSLRLDLSEDQERLDKTVAELKPDILILDPLVRLHRINENDAGEVSTLLNYLRILQRKQNTAVTLVHHTRKNSSTSQPGLALRGSSDIHAWADCSLFLRRKAGRLILVAEHRAAPCPEHVEIKLDNSDFPHLEVVTAGPELSGELCDDIIMILSRLQQPVTRTELRKQLRTRNETLGKALAELEQKHRVERTTSGWRMPAS